MITMLLFLRMRYGKTKISYGETHTNWSEAEIVWMLC